MLLCITAGLLACQSSSNAPDTRFALLDRTTVTTEQMKGKVWLLNFWATSCATCVEEMPELVELYKEHHTAGLDLVAVAMQYDPPAYVARFQQRHQLPFKVAIDNTGENAKAWGSVQLTPTTFLIDQSGNIVQTIVGAPNFDVLKKDIEKLLNNG